MAQQKGRRRTSIWWGILLGALVFDAVIFGLGWGVYTRVQKAVPDVEFLNDYRPRETTAIYAADGTLLATLAIENRQVAELATIPADMINATIAIEDQRFYDHPGVDLRGIARAARENLAGGSLQGASTITQQLARQLKLSRKQTIMRKLTEIILALRIERQFSKEEILGYYLNEIYYGQGAYGVAAAADTFFSKRLHQLALSEAALIAGLAKNPSGYNPFRYPDRCLERRNTVLAKMWELGYIDEPQYQAARNEPIVVKRKPVETWKLHNFRAPWFTTYVIDQVNREYKKEMEEGVGLKIYTTIDMELQARAQELLNGAMDRLRRYRADRGAVVAVEPRTGAILTMVGGRDFAKDEFNGATQAYRQPGSAFKPFVYTAAMERLGMTPSTMESGALQTFRGEWGTYSPKNYSSGQGYTMSLTQALAQSVNLVAVRVALKVGVREVIHYAQLMGIDPGKTRLQPYPSLALGANEVTPLEIAGAYGTFANGGFYLPPYAVTKITSTSGDVIYDQTRDPKRQPRRVISPQTYRNINSMLRAVVTSGTGRRGGISSPAGGKTGTTNSAKDVWYVGITPGFSCAVWVGNDANMRMYGATGGDFCAPIWRDLALKARQLARDRGHAWPDDFPRAGEEGPPDPFKTGRADYDAQSREERGEPAKKDEPKEEDTTKALDTAPTATLDPADLPAGRT